MSQGLHTFEEIREAVWRLPEPDRRRLAEELQRAGSPETAEVRRRAALEKFLAMAGTGHAEVTDISANKNKYLAEIYATKP